jgi:aminoglycoside phosphotransferase family enzyme/predicted kinase
MTDEAAVHAWLTGQADTVIETSCARVYLAGERALKVKKPVDLGFLDFTTVEKRLWALRRELSFNRAYAPDIYRCLRAIVRTADGGLALDANGPVLDWALEMRRFDTDAVLSAHPERIDGAMGETLGRLVARSHVAAPLTPDGGGVAAMRYTLVTNAEQLRGLAGRLDPGMVDALIVGGERALTDHAALLEARKAEGFVRRCHGDLHLGNLVDEGGGPRLFDCIEFNDALSNIDTLYDLAFLVMDLDFRGRAEAANRTLNGYLDEAARGLPRSLWRGLAALPFMLSTRAAVRTHVAAHSGDDGLGARYLTAALTHLQSPAARLIAVGGLSGSGKTTMARALAPGLSGAGGAVVMRSDEIRKRLWSVSPLDRLPPETYSPAASEAVHHEMFMLAREVLEAGRSVILDATFLDPARRAAARTLARTVSVEFDGLWLQADDAQLRARLVNRVDDASDATPAVLADQLGADPGEIDWKRVDAGGQGRDVAAAIAASARH